MGRRSLIIRVVLLAVAAAAVVWFAVEGKHWAVAATALAVLCLAVNIVARYDSYMKKLNYLLGAFENGDLSFHFQENSPYLRDRIFNILLNRLKGFVAGQQRLREDGEAFHCAVENLPRIGLLGVLPDGKVRCANQAAKAMFGIPVLRSLAELDCVIPGLAARLEAMEEGGSLEVPVSSEWRMFDVSVKCHVLREGTVPVRLYVFEEKESEMQETRSQDNAQWQKMNRIISHEVLNTLTPIVSLSDTLLGMAEDRNLREGIEVIGDSARGLLGFVNGYRALSSVPVPQIHPFKLKAMLDYVLQPFLPAIEEMGGSVRFVPQDEDTVLFADEQLMRQVFTNILKNAVAALQDRFKRRYTGVPFIRIRVFVNSSDNTEIQISNNGVPVPDDAADRLFDPFFTTRPGGTGVGLALSRQIMRAHNGTLRLDRSVSGITTFILTI